MDELVSVIISSYNHAPYVEDAVQSVLAQSYPHIELLVIDDGSTDDSVPRLERLQARHGFDLRVQKNKGLSQTLNEAAARARGKFLAPLGSDDVMLPGRLEKQMAYIHNRPEVGICGGNIELMRADGSLLPEEKQRRHESFRRLNFDDVFLERKPQAPAPTMLIRREAFDKVGGFNPEIRLEDLYIQLRIAHAGYYIDVLGEPLAKYRVHSTNTYKNTRFMTDSILRIYADYADHPEYESVRMRLINSMFVKTSNRDPAFARKLLAMLPWRYRNLRTLKGVLRLIGKKLM